MRERGDATVLFSPLLLHSVAWEWMLPVAGINKFKQIRVWIAVLCVVSLAWCI